MQGDRDPEKHSHENIFADRHTGLQEQGEPDQRQHEQVCLQKMDGIDFPAAEEEMHHAIEDKGREHGEAGALPAVVGDLPVLGHHERKVDGDAKEGGNDRVEPPQREQTDEDIRD